MNDELFGRLGALIQEDIGERGLARLFAACPNDLKRASRSLADAKHPRVVVVTGFYIPSAGKPETDGPLGAVLLAEAVKAVGGETLLAAEPWLSGVLREAAPEIEVLDLAPGEEPRLPQVGGADPTHLVAIERPGPAWTDGLLHTMNGDDDTPRHAAVHRWFEDQQRPCVTIGIGDGGNEIGMGRLPRELIEAAIVNGSRIACRTEADHLIVAGISNWGAYALAGALTRLRAPAKLEALFDAESWRRRWQSLIDRNLLVDGRTGCPALSVDGLPWEAYIRRFNALRDLLTPA